MSKTGTTVGDNSDLTDDERSVFSLLGVIRFDAAAVAIALRSRPLTILERHGLANLLDGKQPDGLALKMTGQGRNWKPIRETAQTYERAKAIAVVFDRILTSGETWEQATLATAEHFAVSESTISRNVGLARYFQETD